MAHSVRGVRRRKPSRRSAPSTPNNACRSRGGSFGPISRSFVRAPCSCSTICTTRTSRNSATFSRCCCRSCRRHRCACLSRMLPPEELTELTSKGRLAIVDESVLRFSDREARALVRCGRRRAPRSDRAGVWLGGRTRPAGRTHIGAARRHRLRRQCRATGGIRGARRAARRQLAACRAGPAHEASLLPEVRPEMVAALWRTRPAQNVLLRSSAGSCW